MKTLKGNDNSDCDGCKDSNYRLMVSDKHARTCLEILVKHDIIFEEQSNLIECGIKTGLNQILNFKSDSIDEITDLLLKNNFNDFEISKFLLK